MSSATSSLGPIIKKISLHSHFLLSTRASWSLFAYLYLHKKQKIQTIAMPSFICQSVVAAVHLAKWKIKFLDIDVHSGMVNYGEHLNSLKEVDAVLFVHLLGNRNSIKSLKSFCVKENILLIEDSAQFYPPKEMLESEDHLADVRLISFGATKLIDLNQGAIILSDDKSLLEELNLFKNKYKFKKKKEIKQTIKNFKNSFYELKEKLVNGIDIRDSMKELLPAYVPAISMEVNFNNDLIEEISKGIINLHSEINTRQLNMKKYEAAFKGTKLIPISNHKFIPWRASFRIEGLSYASQFKISEFLRSQGYDVSNWYIPAHWYFDSASLNDQKLSNTLKLSKEIIQFWVNNHYDNYHFNNLRKLIDKIMTYEK